MTRPLLAPTPTVCYEYSYPDSNANNNKANNGFLVRPASEHHYEQPMVVFPSFRNGSGSSPADSMGKAGSGGNAGSRSSDGCGTSTIASSNSANAVQAGNAKVVNKFDK